MLEERFHESLTRAYRRVPGAGDPAPDEDRIVFGGISWEQYLAIDEERGPEAPAPRLYYLDGQLEITATSRRHEHKKKWIDWLLLEFLGLHDIDVFAYGQATLRKLQGAGAEPDESWCFGEDKPTPDLVLEVALTSGGLDKLDVYGRFGVPEVWFWRRDALEVWTLRPDRSGYEGPASASRVLPALDLALLTRCLDLPTWREARRAFREAAASAPRG